jgi:hypothetical protein
MRFVTYAFVAVLVISGLARLNPAKADETAGEKVQNAGTDVKRDAKKAGRDVKRSARKATGRNTVGHEVRDKVNDAKDDVRAGAKKAKRKAD